MVAHIPIHLDHPADGCLTETSRMQEPRGQGARPWGRVEWDQNGHKIGTNTIRIATSRMVNGTPTLTKSMNRYLAAP